MFYIKNPAMIASLRNILTVSREMVKPFAECRQFGKDVVRHRDDMAADIVRLNNVVNLARARPDQFLLLVRLHNLERKFHIG